MKLMGLDVGSRTVGVAISDVVGWTAQGVEIIRINEDEEEFGLDRVAELVKEHDAGGFVLGLPKNMNNTEGERVSKTIDFKSNLERRTGLAVELWDERLTTVAADRIMMEAGIRREHRKDYVDMIAAELILQGYLDKRRLGEK